MLQGWGQLKTRTIYTMHKEKGSRASDNNLTVITKPISDPLQTLKASKTPGGKDPCFDNIKKKQQVFA